MPLLITKIAKHVRGPLDGRVYFEVETERSDSAQFAIPSRDWDGLGQPESIRVRIEGLTW